MMTEKIGAWVGVIASVVTIVLTVMNYQLKSDLEKAKLDLEAARTEIERTKAQIEQSRERTERYEFVNGLLPDLLKDNAEMVTLRTNLISLVLKEDEASRLFAGFAASSEKAIKKAGDAGMKAVEGQTRYQQALDLEREGFSALVAGDLHSALQHFEDIVAIYPDFHSASEIAQLLHDQQAAFDSQTGRKAIYQMIVRRYSWKAPQPYLDQLRELAK
jgi:hypothetical protein